MDKACERKRADIILYYKPNIPVAVVEAKDNKHTVGDRKYNGLVTEEAEETSLCSYFFDAGGRSPRYYQRIAINRTVENMKILTTPPLDKLGTATELVGLFGGKPQYLAAIRELETEIYRAA